VSGILLDFETSVIGPDFDTLKTTISTYLNRSDLDSQIPIFIEMAHRRFNRTLMVPERERSFQDTIAQGYPLPVDFQFMKSITIVDADDTPLEQISYTNLRAEGEYSARPQRFAISTEAIYFSPQPDSDYTIEIIYVSTIPMLGAFQASNWLLERHPDAYVYGALAQATALLDAADPRIQLWQSALDLTIAEIAGNGNQRRTSAATPRLRPSSYA
jgi:hypothetical protein